MKRFWDKVIKGINCWQWTGSTHRREGYGVIRVGRQILAHRISWILHHGAIPGGMCVLHRCDNPSCTNPDHLFLGTQADNLADMRAKGRQQKGEKHHRAKLTELDILNIRILDIPQSALAKLYEVTQPTICAIKTRHTWKEVA